MTEILWKSSAPHLPAQNHELVELRMIEVGSPTAPSYLVREIHASWSAAAQQIQWKGFSDKAYLTEQDALRSFTNRRESIVNAGYPFTTTLN